MVKLSVGQKLKGEHPEQEFEIVEILKWEGNLSKGYLVESNGDQLVAKVLKNQEEIDLEQFEQEVNSLKKLRDVTGIIQLINYGIQTSLDDKLVTHLEMEKAGTNLNHLENFPHTRENAYKILGLFYEAAEIICRINDEDIVHRDIKPENILFADPSYTFENCNGDGRLKIVDFGCAVEVGYQPKERLFYGSLPFIPHESIIEGVIHRSRDLFALSVSMFCTLSRVLPFDGIEPVDFYFSQEKGVHIFSDHRPDLRGSGLDKFFIRTLNWDIDKRYSGEEYLSELEKIKDKLS